MGALHITAIFASAIFAVVAFGAREPDPTRRFLAPLEVGCELSVGLAFGWYAVVDERPGSLVCDIGESTNEPHTVKRFVAGKRRHG